MNHLIVATPSAVDALIKLLHESDWNNAPYLFGYEKDALDHVAEQIANAKELELKSKDKDAA